MKLFILPDCPYCLEVLNWIKELKAENQAYQSLKIEVIDESIAKELADLYDYYYVPTIYFGNQKLHEGVASKEKIRNVFDHVLASL